MKATAEPSVTESAPAIETSVEAVVATPAKLPVETVKVSPEVKQLQARLSAIEGAVKFIASRIPGCEADLKTCFPDL